MRKKEPWSQDDRWEQQWTSREAKGDGGKPAPTATLTATLEPGEPAQARSRARCAREGATQAGGDEARGGLRPQERALLAQALTALTPRERDVVEAVWVGGTNEAVAERMCVAPPTLRTHLMRIHRKLGTRDKGEIVRFVAQRLLEGYRTGLLPVEGV
ncbi:MAG: LuxR family transcriptional regulator [Planctomycetota bacterium]|nr:MAG: LuxR family transcriptional regulator [Planctomycetota bacterium]